MHPAPAALALFLGIYTPAQYGPFGPYGPYGRPPPGAYDAPPCNPYYNPDCGRFRWEGPRSREWRCQEHPFGQDCPRGPGYPPDRVPPYNPEEE